MKATFEIEDAVIFFDDRRADRVVFLSRFEKPLELTLDQFIEVLERVKKEKAEAKEFVKSSALRRRKRS